jgi:FixJ family two-component response regulator
MNEFIAKPVQQKELARTLARWLDGTSANLKRQSESELASEQ